MSLSFMNDENGKLIDSLYNNYCYNSWTSPAFVEKDVT